MLTLAELEPYREKANGMIGLVPNPPDHSTDNGLLFTSTAIALLADEKEALFARDHLHDIAKACEIQDGVYARYPGEKVPSSWDDHLGLACASQQLALYIEVYGNRSDWTWGGNWLARIPIFGPTVRAAAGLSLSDFSLVLAAVPFLTDCFQPRSSTSGRCLLFLAQRVLAGRNKRLDAAIGVWRWRMAKLYPGGMKDVYAVYFGPQHPFAVHGPVNFT